MEIKDLEKLFDLKLERIHDKLDVIEAQTIKTNGRVTEIESDIELVKMFNKYPKMLGLVVMGIIATALMGIANFFTN